MQYELLEVKITGTSPLKMHNERLANPLDDVTKRIKAVSSKRKKTDEDYAALMELEFEGGLYFDEKIGPYLPDRCIKAMIRDAAKKSRNGTNVSESLLIVESRVPLNYEGPRTVSGLWAKKFYDCCGVGIGPKRIMRTRPMFTEWNATFSISFDASAINRDELLAWLDVAGTRTGFMDHRPEFGRFSVEVVS